MFDQREGGWVRYSQTGMMELRSDVHLAKMSLLNEHGHAVKCVVRVVFVACYVDQ